MNRQDNYRFHRLDREQLHRLLIEFDLYGEVHINLDTMKDLQEEIVARGISRDVSRYIDKLVDDPLDRIERMVDNAYDALRDNTGISTAINALEQAKILIEAEKAK